MTWLVSLMSQPKVLDEPVARVHLARHPCGRILHPPNRTGQTCLPRRAAQQTDRRGEGARRLLGSLRPRSGDAKLPQHLDQLEQIGLAPLDIVCAPFRAIAQVRVDGRNGLAWAVEVDLQFARKAEIAGSVVLVLCHQHEVAQTIRALLALGRISEPRAPWAARAELLPPPR